MTEPKADYITREPLGEGLTCLCCGKPGPALDIHHIIKRSQRPDLVDDPMNKVPLCRTCHNRIDNEAKWTNFVRDVAGIGSVYFVVDLHGKEFAKRRVVLSERWGCLVERGQEETTAVGHPGEPAVIAEGEQGITTLGEIFFDAGNAAVWSPPPSAIADNANSDFPILPTPAEWERARHMSVEELALLSEQAHRYGLGMYLRHCEAVWAYRESHKFQDWTDTAVIHFSRYGRTKLYGQAAVFERFMDWWNQATALQQDLFTNVSDRQIRLLERVQERQVIQAFDEAIDHVAETGRADAESLAARLQEKGLLPKPKRASRKGLLALLTKAHDAIFKWCPSPNEDNLLTEIEEAITNG